MYAEANKIAVSVLRKTKTGDLMADFEPLVSVQEAARLLGGISKWTIYAWCSQGKLHKTKVGRRTMLRQTELARVIQDEKEEHG
jgi:excisionase family DNA binding protein